MGILDRLRKWYLEITCSHLWRPVLHDGYAARWCERCDRVERLSVEEFYARFGRMPHTSTLVAKEKK